VSSEIFSIESIEPASQELRLLFCLIFNDLQSSREATIPSAKGIVGKQEFPWVDSLLPGIRFIQAQAWAGSLSGLTDRSKGKPI